MDNLRFTQPLGRVLIMIFAWTSGISSSSRWDFLVWALLLLVLFDVWELIRAYRTEGGVPSIRGAILDVRWANLAFVVVSLLVIYFDRSMPPDLWKIVPWFVLATLVLDVTVVLSGRIRKLGGKSAAV